MECVVLEHDATPANEANVGDEIGDGEGYMTKDEDACVKSLEGNVCWKVSKWGTARACKTRAETMGCDTNDEEIGIVKEGGKKS
jgi:hypothetical protein